ncbi:hypothetical protein EOE67_03490 [Rheinheimera riviphila]|uniref:Tfp pilus assembly protein PilO n=1 Tax=Rheinheimera riviphila TaxID=1834037 RepID=A0A437R3B3_9GAMM|nr:hypothetical protein [Rheinheimera riviphila]RVU41276.1 hypothetical protein EOE67_03490 [Rheinheimera riviphila]
MLKNKPLLLAVLGLLLLLKFVVQPWYQGQSAKLDELSISNQRLAKVFALQQIAEPLHQDLTTLQQRLADLKQQLPVAENAQAMALQTQNSWQLLFEQQQVKVELFDWVGEREFAAAGFQIGRIQLRLSGKLHQLALAGITLQQRFPSASIEASQINQSGGLKMDNQAEQQLTIDVLYQLESAQ